MPNKSKYVERLESEMLIAQSRIEKLEKTVGILVDAQDFVAVQIGTGFGMASLSKIFRAVHDKLTA